MPYEMLRYILSFNTYPYCNGVCKYLMGIEDSLHMERYRRIMRDMSVHKDKNWGSGLVSSLIEKEEWESLSFVFSYIWYIYQSSSVDKIADILSSLQEKGRHSMAIKLLKLYELDMEIVGSDGCLSSIMSSASADMMEYLCSRYSGDDVMEMVLIDMVSEPNMEAIASILTRTSCTLVNMFDYIWSVAQYDNIRSVFEYLDEKGIDAHYDVLLRKANHQRKTEIFNIIKEHLGDRFTSYKIPETSSPQTHGMIGLGPRYKRSGEIYTAATSSLQSMLNSTDEVLDDFDLEL